LGIEFREDYEELQATNDRLTGELATAMEQVQKVTTSRNTGVDELEQELEALRDHAEQVGA
jgi:hypothetical protein